MSLCKLPDVGYTYLNIESEGCSFTGESMDNPRSAQFWVDVELDANLYVPAIWWKFWKKTVTFKIFACGGTIDSFYQTVKLQYK